MSQLQGLAVSWLSALVALLPLSYAFGAGMIAAVNPCGFAMLPAYLSLYLGVDEGDPAGRSALQRVSRAVVVGGSVSAGFVLLFAVAGTIISAGGYLLVSAMPWLGALVGAGLIVLGICLLLGRSLSPALFKRLADRLARPGQRTVRGFFLFGLAYAVASLGCTLPIFLVAVGSALTSGGFLNGMVQFVSYALGMGTVIIALTVALSLFKLGMVGWLRRAMPYVQPAAAVLLVVAGGWIVHYWSPQLLDAILG